MKSSLKNRLILSFCSLIFICIALMIILTNSVLDKQFSNYVIKRQEQKNSEIVSQINVQYLDSNKWNTSMIESIGINALSEGVILKLTDVNGQVIWDATKHNNGLCAQMIDHMAENTLSRHPNLNGSYTEKEFDVISENNKVGILELGYYGPFYYSDMDLNFITTLNNLFIVVAIISIFFAIILAIIIARNIVKPIEYVVKNISDVSRGINVEKIENTTNSTEISNLIDSINNFIQMLDEQENLRKRLTTDMAHELRTPLASIQGSLEAMIDGIWEPNEERLKSCHEEITRITKMVKDLEKLTDYEADNIELNIERVEVSSIMKKILNNFEKQIHDKNIKLIYNLNEVFAFVDKDKISQVFTNIISNSIKYTQDNGIIEVNVFEEENKVCVKIKDNGTGIEKEHLPYIFERLYRADSSRCRCTGGSGIGLTITKKLVELHNGIITISSEKNIGTEVIIIIEKNINESK